MTAAEAAAAQMVPSAAAGKRLAQPDGTPNKGGARKNAPAVRDRGEGSTSSGVHSLLLPPSHQTAEEAEVAEVLAVLDMADAADAAAEATAAAEAAKVAEAAEAAEAAQAAQASQAAQAAQARIAAYIVGQQANLYDLTPEEDAEYLAACTEEYDKLAPELAELFVFADAKQHNTCREHAHFAMRELDDYDLEAQFAGSALELLRRNSDLSKWRRELFALLKCAGVEGGEAEYEAARGEEVAKAAVDPEGEAVQAEWEAQEAAEVAEALAIEAAERAEELQYNMPF